MTRNEDRFLQASRLLSRMELHDELEGLLESLIPVLDSFERLESYTGSGAPGDDPAAALLTTCGRIRQQLCSALTDVGFTSFGAPGDSVDLGRYRVVDARPRTDLPAGTVVEVVRPGYHKDGRIFRPAEVIVVELPKESKA